MNSRHFLLYLLLPIVNMPLSAQAADSTTVWLAALDTTREQLLSVDEAKRAEEAVRLWGELEQAHPTYSDWLLQDAFDDGLWAHVPAGGRQDCRAQAALIGDKLARLLVSLDAAQWRRMTSGVVLELRSRNIPFRRVRAASAPKLAAQYLRACALRREHRLAPLLAQGWNGIVFAQHFNMGASHYAYTEGLSDAQNERHFYPGAKLTLLRMEGTRGVAETLLEDGNGVIRDVDVSWDGTKILFAWKKSDRADDYSLYEMDAVTREIRAVTGELGHADYEAAYLPNGDIVFNSTRCVQTVDCWWTEVSNLYTCSADGRYLRRLTFDQVHTNYPAVIEDGRVLYTRWDYNDRGQLFPQGLFEMLSDGTGQREFYGNNSWFPTTILHARGIPGTQKALAIFTGHHSWQAGKIGVLDPALGRQENEGAQLIAPVRRTPAERIDRYGQEGDLAKYPYPVDDRHFLVSYAPRGWEQHGVLWQMRRPVFGLYFMDVDGRRELLHLDTEKELSVGRMMPLAARPVPAARPSGVDYRKDSGIYYIQDIYQGQGLEGVARGGVKSLRVVALEYRAAGIGDNRNKGVAGAALVSTPIAIGNGSWDVKIPLGNAQVYEDGSAMFVVPARTPVYFQALDGKGRAIQSMRSWSTLQPGETQSCVGCHENKNTTPPAQAAPTQAMRAGAQPLEPVYGEARGFSFAERIQPILDKHCIRCHDGDENKQITEETKAAFSLLSTPRLDEQAKRYWSAAYLRLIEGGPDAGPARWISAQSAPSMCPPHHTGAARSPLVEMLEAGHNGVQLSVEEMRLLCCWIDLAVPFCGDYAEANAWTAQEKAIYDRFLKKRNDMAAIENRNIKEYAQGK